MRKHPIVQEYINKDIPGTYVMKEKTNLMCGKMMDIENIIRVTYPYSLKTSIASIENKELLYDLNYDNIKKNSIISINVDKSQSKTESEINTKWILEFDSKYLLREYLYNEIFTLNSKSAFNLIDINNIPNNKIGQACYNYIDSNLMDRYRLKEVIFWVEYHKLKDNIVSGSGSDIVYNPEIKLLYKTPVFSLHAVPNTLPDNKKASIALKPYIDGTYEISYKQDQSSQYFTFVYYFDVIFEKI